MICVRKLTIIGSDNGLSPGWRQAIIWTNAGTLLIRTLGTNFSEILSAIHGFSLKKMHLKMSAKWCPFCLGLNVLTSPLLPWRPTLMLTVIMYWVSICIECQYVLSVIMYWVSLCIECHYVLSVIMYWVSLCAIFTNSLIACCSIMMVATIIRIFMPITIHFLFILTYTFKLSGTRLFSFCNCTLPCMFLSLEHVFEYWIEHFTFGLLCVMFKFTIRIFNVKQDLSYLWHQYASMCSQNSVWRKALHLFC